MAETISLAGITDAARLSALLVNATDEVRREFIRLIGGARGIRSLERIAELISTNRIQEAMDLMDEVAPAFVNKIEAAYLAAGLSTAAAIRSHAALPFLDFNMLNTRSVQLLQNSRLRIITNFTQEQRRATMLAITEGLTLGESPIAIARRFQGSIGLSARQVQDSNAYRRSLMSLNTHALDYKLRDKRFDRTVVRAINGGRPLTQEQIDNMVKRYEDRAVIKRSKDIAETEALSAVNGADEEMWRQAVEAGAIDPGDIETAWWTTLGPKVRDSHAEMHGQTRPFGQPFLSGDGNLLMYPGDPSAPPGDIINCQCVRARSLGAVAP